MSEFEQVIVAGGAAAPPSHILEGLNDELSHRKPAGAPHSIYEELWHITFWQQVTLDWIDGIEIPFPASPVEGFPTVMDMEKEDWIQLCQRFVAANEKAGAVAREESRLNSLIRFPSRPGQPLRVMTTREQLESLGAHNAYHFGRIVLLRQLLGIWPPVSSGYSW
jgi:uncharacterized damage-inducible protein DinB